MRTLIILFLCLCSTLGANERLYFNSRDCVIRSDAIRIHTGHNVWIQTSSVRHDITGSYSLMDDIVRDAPSFEYVKHWKCPYCHHYWPLGVACQNPDCPSRYK